MDQLLNKLIYALSLLKNSSFLPQDKVVEFSQMTPQQLLLATEQAAGHKKLVEWHDTLINEGQNLKKLTSVCIRTLIYCIYMVSLVVEYLGP